MLLEAENWVKNKTFVDIFPYIFTFIVWLHFVNHLLNYYLLTYLLRKPFTVDSPILSFHSK